jgi:dephospho-CoA kinase
MTKLIGLTGGIATGKSLVSQALRSKGVPVLDADEFAREVVAPGTFGLRAIVQIFGKEVLDGESLNRQALGNKIFQDERARSVLERITHPLIQWRARREFEAFANQGEPIVFYDAALIFEKNLTSLFDAVAVVSAPPEVQLKRLMHRDKISETEAKRRIDCQWPLEKKVAAAQFVIDNSGSSEATHKQVSELLNQLKKLKTEDGG